MLNIGLIGAGTMGNTHNRAYKQLTDTNIAAVCDIDESKAVRIAEQWGAKVYTSVEDMLNDAKIDAVDICLPTDMHRSVTEMAAARGIHVFCEKPIAVTEADAEAMIEACRAAGVMLMVGHVVRFFPEYRLAREQLLAGKFGKPGVIRSIRSGAFPIWSSWFKDYSRSGGPLIDLAIHDFDYLRWCFGPVRRVFSRTLGKQEEGLDHALTVLRFESGVIAHVEASWAYPQGAPFQTSLEIAGTDALALYDRQSSFSVVKFGGTKEQNMVPESPLARSPYALELQHFADCIRTGETPLTSGEEALASLQVSIAAVESSRTNRVVELKAVKI